MVKARFLLLLLLHPDAADMSFGEARPEFVLGREGSCLRKPANELVAGELLCCEADGRGTLANRLSSELVSVEEGSVDVEPCWPFA